MIELSSRRYRKENEETEYEDITTGPLKDRRFGLRIDDDVIVRIMAGDRPLVVEGRVLKHTTTALELIDTEGIYHWISNDWIIEVVLKKHNRPHPSDDPEYKKPKRQVRKSSSEKETQSSKPRDKESVYYI